VLVLLQAATWLDGLFDGGHQAGSSGARRGARRGGLQASVANAVFQSASVVSQPPLTRIAQPASRPAHAAAPASLHLARRAGGAGADITPGEVEG
jgi:hypothetical protein